MRHAEQKTFETHDKVALFYRYWPAASGTPRGAILLFHRGHEHSGRMAHLADELDLPDFAVFAWDARGHGLSPGERGFSPSLGTATGGSLLCGFFLKESTAGWSYRTTLVVSCGSAAYTVFSMPPSTK